MRACKHLSGEGGDSKIKPKITLKKSVLITEVNILLNIRIRYVL